MATAALLEISRSEVLSISTASVPHITEVKHLASYNWLDSSTPTIAVPGSPPAWSNVKLPKKLPKDSGLVYINQNAARYAHSPLEPLFRALYVENPGFDVRKVDIISDRNNIRKLLSFIDSTTSRNGLEAFTIRVEIVKQTALFSREDALVQDFIGQNDFRGFGHEFEKAYTKTQIVGSTGHHRVISYQFDGLMFVVRHETDAYVHHHDGPGSASWEDDILEGMQSLSVDPACTDTLSVVSGSGLAVRKTGREIPLDSTLEIKTRVAHKPISMDEVAPQLWVSQTPKLVRAYHTSGVFEPPTVEDATTLVNSWEKRHRESLSALGSLMKKIVNAARCNGQITIRYQPTTDTLIIIRGNDAKMLPDDLYHRWEMAPSTKGGPSVSVNTDDKNGNCPPIDVKAKMDSDMKDIRVGDQLYSIPLHKFPYLRSFIQSKTAAPPIAVEINHPPVRLFDIAVKGVVNGYRRCFRLLENDVNLFKDICDTFNFLEVDVLDGQSLNDITMNIKAGKTDFDLHEKGDKRLARDSAFRLVYYMLCRQEDSTVEAQNKIYNAVLYVVSHPGTFGARTRRIVRDICDRQLQFSAKQKTSMDRWKTGGVASEDDSTTASSSYDYFDSSDDYNFNSD